MRHSTLWIDTVVATAQAALDELRLCVYAFPRSLWAHLSAPEKEPRFEQDIRAAMGEAAASDLLAAPHRPLRALSMLSTAMDNLPIDEQKQVAIDKSCILIGDGKSDVRANLLVSVPLVTRPPPASSRRGCCCRSGCTARLEQFDLGHLALLPTTTLFSIFLFGIRSSRCSSRHCHPAARVLCNDVKAAAEE